MTFASLSAGPGPWLIGVSGSIILIILGYAIWSTISASRRDPRSELIKRIQGQWQSPLLEHQLLAGRLVDVLTAPLCREDFRLTLTIAGAPPRSAADFAEDKTRIHVDVDSEFYLVNLGPKPVVVTLNQASLEGPVPPSDARQGAGISVDGAPYMAQDGNTRHDIEIAPGGKRQISITSRQEGMLPFFAMFPQSTPAPRGVTIAMSLQFPCSAGLLVTGPGNHAYYADEWWRTRERLEHTMTVDDPVLPGDAVVLTIGV